jgi:hypothetical protein
LPALAVVDEEGEGRGEKGSLEGTILEEWPGSAELGWPEISKGYRYVRHKRTRGRCCGLLPEKKAHVLLGLGLQPLQL